MKRSSKNRGFSLVELMIAVVVFGIGMAAAVGGFMPLVQNAKQQTRIAETAIEKHIGLDLLRADLEQAGLGLPWEIQEGSLWAYQEAVDVPAMAFNDDGMGTVPVPVPTGAPRPIVVSNDAGAGYNPTGPDNGLGINMSDYLVLKGTPLAGGAETQKWSYLQLYRPPPPVGGNAQLLVKDWGDPTVGITLWNPWDEVIDPQTRVIAIKPTTGSSERSDKRVLMLTNGGKFFSPFSTAGASYPLRPTNIYETYILFGVSGSDEPKFPFNRADYYIEKTGAASRCAPGTGTLVKAVIAQADGTTAVPTPLLDCVADFQVILGWDLDNEAVGGGDKAKFVGSYTDGGATKCYTVPFVDPNIQNNENCAAELLNIRNTYMASAEDLRLRLREIRVYILAHEGGANIDMNYEDPFVDVGEYGLGHDSVLDNGPGEFDLKTAIGADDYKNYQWQVYSLVVRPEGLGAVRQMEEN